MIGTDQVTGVKNADIGFDGIEFRGYQPKEFAALSFREYASQIAACSKKYGLTVIIFGIGVDACASEDKEARENQYAKR